MGQRLIVFRRQVEDMKFYDIDALENKCNINNKYKITALVAARARWLSEQKTITDENLEKEKYLSAALWEIENDKLPAAWVDELEKAAASSSKDACVETVS